MNERIDTLSIIDKLHDNNCSVCSLKENSLESYCMAECPIGDQLRKQGKQLLKTSQETVEKLLSKGEELTFKEVIFLNKEKSIPQNIIAEAIGMDRTSFGKMLRKYLRY